MHIRINNAHAYTKDEFNLIKSKIGFVDYYSLCAEKRLQIKSINLDLRNTSDCEFISKFKSKPYMKGVKGIFIFINIYTAFEDLVEYLDNIPEDNKLLNLGILFCSKIKIHLHQEYVEWFSKLFSKVKKEIWIHGADLSDSFKQIIKASPNIQAFKFTLCNIDFSETESLFEDDDFSNYLLSKLWLDDSVKDKRTFSVLWKEINSSSLGSKLTKIWVRSDKFLNMLDKAASKYLPEVETVSHKLSKYSLASDLANFGFKKF